MIKINQSLAAIITFTALSCMGPSPALAAGMAGATPTGMKHQAAKHQAPKAKVIIQVSDSDPKKWNLALNNAQNVQEDYGKNNVDIEVVAYGPGLNMVKMESEAGPRVADAIDNCVKIVACENTMNKQHLSKADMLPNLDYVKSGVPELMKKQKAGYAYIRP